MSRSIASSIGLARVRALLVLGAAFALTASCGSGLVKGWRTDADDEANRASFCNAQEDGSYDYDNHVCTHLKDASKDTASLTEDQCRVRDSAVWTDGACKDLAQVEQAQCGVLPGVVWRDGKCVTQQTAQCNDDPTKVAVEGDCLTRPSLSTKTPELLVQTISAGLTMKPVQFDVPQGTTLDLRQPSCPDFFTSTATSTVSSKDPMTLAAGLVSCSVQVVAVDAAGAYSQPQTISLTILRGFYAVCNDATASQAAQTTVAAIWAATGKYGCDDVGKDLVARPTLDLTCERTDAVDGCVPLTDLTPLAGLGSLAVLKLAGNDVKDLGPLTSLTALRQLDLRGNARVDDLSALAKLPQKDLLLLLDGTALALHPELRTPDNCPRGPDVNPRVAGFCAAPAPTLTPTPAPTATPAPR